MTFVLAKDRMLLNICHGGGLGNRLLEEKDKLAFKIKSHINNTTSFKKDSKLTGHELFAIYQLFLMTFNSLFLRYVYISSILFSFVREEEILLYPSKVF